MLEDLVASSSHTNHPTSYGPSTDPPAKSATSPRIRDLVFPCQQRPFSQGPEQLQRIYRGGHQDTEVDSHILPS